VSLEALFAEVLEIVREIPPGRVATYGEIAALAGRPGAARWVGRVLSALPEGSGVPWHRVLAAGGRITIGGGRGAPARRQRALLEAEGVELTPAGRVRMDRHSWGGMRARPGR
jgi:methylated-DNA-protein-cysteine methyltransferase-like protein